jgi:twinkle protein
MSDGTTVELHIPCPDCPSSDGYVIYDSGWGHCFACGLNRRTTDEDIMTETTIPKMRKGLIPFQPQAFPKRRITKATAVSHGFGLGKFSGKPCQVATYCDDKGEPVAQKLKFPGKEFIIVGAANKMQLWQQHRYGQGGRRVIVFEGETDLLCWQSINAGKEWPAVSLPNGADPKAKAIKQNLAFLSSFNEIILCFDNDEAGRACVEAAVAVIPPGKAKIMSIPGGHNDVCDAVQHDMQSEMRDAFWNAKTYRPDGIVGSEEILEAVLSFEAVGDPTPWSGLNAKTMGIRQGELVTLTAGTGIGKSHLCRILAAHLMASGKKVGYIALEESVSRTGLGMLEQVLKKPMHLGRNGVTDDDIRKAWATHLEGKISVFNHHGSMDAENLLNRVRFMRQADDCDYVIIDHLSILVSGWDSATGDERRLIDNVMTALRSIVAQTGVGMILVSHLSKGDNKTSHEEGARPRLRDLRGSQAIAQLSDTVIALSRDQQGKNPNVSQMHVLKCRYTGLCGLACYLQYSPTTGEMVEIEPPQEEADDYFESD